MHYQVQYRQKLRMQEIVMMNQTHIASDTVLKAVGQSQSTMWATSRQSMNLSIYYINTRTNNIAHRTSFKSLHLHSQNATHFAYLSYLVLNISRQIILLTASLTQEAIDFASAMVNTCMQCFSACHLECDVCLYV